MSHEILQRFRMGYHGQRWLVECARFPNANGLIRSVRRIEPDYEWMDFEQETNDARAPDGEVSEEILGFLDDRALRAVALRAAELWDAHWVVQDVRVAREWEAWAADQPARNCRIRFPYEISADNLKCP